MYKIKVNDNQLFDIETGSDGIKVNGETRVLDLIRISESQSHILYNNRSYNVEVVAENRQAKQMTIKVNGNIYHITAEDQYDQLLKRLGLDSLAASKIKEVKAPMPGLVLNIIAKVGQEVKKGENLLVLEAMKMENILKSPADGTIQKIVVNIGDKVEKNQVLVIF